MLILNPSRKPERKLLIQIIRVRYRSRFAYASNPANGINVGDWLSLFPDSGDTTAPTQTDELAKLEGGNVFE